MRLCRLHLLAFGPFTDLVLEFGASGHGIAVVYGPNEAGKSSALRAISDLRFGIPSQSRDNFVHAHPQMRVGGEFVDRQGRTYSLMRRKGRGATLLYADFTLQQASETAAPPEVEALLTGGLTKDAYDSMFGLDHQRLREGGEALLKGEGDVGAALFEASAGVRSIPGVLERLDATARKFFMPGARGKNARINEALALYESHHDEFRKTQVRPAQWADLFRKHQLAHGELSDLEHRQQALNGKLLLIRELRAVAPLLGTLDHATRVLRDLADVTLLPANAPSARAVAESGISEARHNSKAAADEVMRQSRRLDELKPDTAILSLGPAIKRLASQAEAIDQHRREMADAGVDVDSLHAQVGTLAAHIDPRSGAEEVLKRAPTPAADAGIQRLLQAVELAQQAFDHHRESGRPHSEERVSASVVLPSAESLTALRIAQAEIARNDVTLRRLSTLPGDIKSARRAVASALEALGLTDESTLRRVRPLLDAQIDAALKDGNANATRRSGLMTRIDEIAGALPDLVEKRDQLLAQGRVTTREDVERARVHRDSSWALVRGTYIDRTRPAIESDAHGGPLAEVYERAVIAADDLIDELAGDTDRAAQFQAGSERILTLEKDQDELARRLEDLARDEAARQANWTEMLVAAALPPLSPAVLRDWQALLPPARDALETLRVRLDEFEQSQGVEKALAARLRAAIVATGLANPAEDALLGTLSATAAEVDEVVRQRQAAIHNAEGKEIERERQRLERVARESQLIAALGASTEAAKAAMTDLLLSEDSDVSVARARITEFRDLAEASGRLLAAQTRARRAEQALSVISSSAATIWESLGQSAPADLRVSGERLFARLSVAEGVQAERALVQLSADNARKSERDHVATVLRHEAVIVGLCQAAAVDSPTQLPEAEENSRRRREAQMEIDRSQAQLALASRHSVDELRTALADQDPARMDAEEKALAQERSELTEKMRLAREREESTRRDLEAVDASDAAAAARDAMERAASGVRANMGPWIRTKIAHALLSEALKRFRDRAQGPMLTAASRYFERMTRGEFVRLVSDDSGKEPVLIAQRSRGARVRVEEMSEGTLDQLYLALRLAALDVRRSAGVDLPVVLDDVLMTSDEDRSGAMLEALAEFARENQVIVFTHHRHIVDVAVQSVPAEKLALVTL